MEVPSQVGEIESEFRWMMKAQGDGFPVRDDDEIEELGRYDYNLPEIFSWSIDRQIDRYVPILQSLLGRRPMWRLFLVIYMTTILWGENRVRKYMIDACV